MRATELVRRPDRSERQGSDEPGHALKFERRELTGQSVLGDGFLRGSVRLEILVDPRRHLSFFGNSQDN